MAWAKANPGKLSYGSTGTLTSPHLTMALIAQKLGLALVQNSPFGLGAPRDTPPAVVKRLHDAFKQAMKQDSYRTALARYDMLPMYMGSAAYQKFAQETFAKGKALVEKLGLARPQ